ncbi:MAG: TetR/AcrR family transcriptional regulator [Proteocatella sp.]
MAKKRKEQLIQFNKSNILDAAKKLFSEKGILQTTMDDIAKEADYSKSTIYVYFSSKEEIYNHIIFESMLLLKETLSDIVDSEDGFENCYYKICNTLVHIQKEYPIYFESIIGEISVNQDDFEMHPVLLEIFNVGEEINQNISTLIQRGISDNYIRADIETLPAVFMIWASISGIISMASQKEEYLQEKLNIKKEEYLNYSFKMLLRSLSKESK